MKLGIFAKTFTSAGNLEALFNQIKEHGINHVHFNMICSGLGELPLEIPDEVANNVSSLASDKGLDIVGLSATFNMIHPDVEIRKEGLRSLEVLASSCNKLGTNFLSLCTGSKDENNKWKWHPDNDTAEAWQDLLHTMEKALEIAEKHKVILGVEPEAANVVKNALKARKLLNELKSDRIKIILDPANLFETAKNSQQIRDLITEALDLLHDDIVVVHAKDRTLNGHFKAAGQGDVDFEFFVQQLRGINFSGPLVMHGLGEHEVKPSVEFLKSIGI